MYPGRRSKRNCIIGDFMKDGAIALSFKAGQITKMTLKGELDHIYGKMFLNARKATHKNPDKIRNGIRVIIFGCFWIEAKCNNHLKYLIDHELTKEHFRKSVWKSLERVGLLKKLSIIFALAQDIGFVKGNAPLGKLQKVIDLRNRLAHAKEEEIPFDESCITDMVSAINETDLQERPADAAMTSIVNFFNGLSDPDLMLELKAPKINEHVETIKSSSIWLDSIYKSYCRSIHIKVSSPKL